MFQPAYRSFEPLSRFGRAAASVYRWSQIQALRLCQLVLFSLLFVGLTACNNGGGGGGGNSSSPPQPPPTVTGISLNHSSVSANHGDVVTLVASAHYSDGTIREVTDASTISWEKNSNLIFLNETASGSCEVTSARRTQGVVTASHSGFTASAQVEFVPVFISVEINPNPMFIPPEFLGQFTFFAHGNDGINDDISDSAIWAVDDPTIGQVGNPPLDAGVFSATRSGDAVVTATHPLGVASAIAKVMPIRLLGRNGVPFPNPNSLMTPAQVGIDGQGRITASWSYQASGEVFVTGHDKTEWTERKQINVGQTPWDFAYTPSHLVGEAGHRMLLWNGNNSSFYAFATSFQDFGAAQVLPFSRNNIRAAVIKEDGEVLVLWSSTATYVSSFDPTTLAWSAPTLIAAQPVWVAAMNRNSDAVLVWEKPGSQPLERALYAAVYLAGTDPGSGLQPEQQLFQREQGTPIEISLNINSARDSFVVWSGQNAATLPRSVHSARYTFIGGWNIESIDLGGSFYPSDVRVSQNASGHAVIAWVDPAHLYVYAVPFSVSSGWGMTEAISTTAGLGTPKINGLAVAASGNAICILEDGASFAMFPYKYRRFIVGQGWQPMSTLDHIGHVGNPYMWSVRYNQQGDGVLGWEEVAGILNPEGGYYPVSYGFMERAPSIDP